MQTYVVQRGDTLYGISKQFGITVEEIKLENDMTNNTISVGQVLRIPTTATTSLYIVKRGDTLYSIASKYGVSVSELMRINDLKSSTLSIGQQLRIPINGLPSNDNYIIYTVKVGDNLYSIAKQYNVSVKDIVSANNLATNTLAIGQQLKIPVSVKEDEDYEYSTYIVQSGDNLYKIAKKFGMTVNQLMKVNNLETTNLSIGQVLKVQTGGNSFDIPMGSTCYGSGYKEPQWETYTVKRGDSLYTIAKKFGVSVDDLIEVNELKNNNLSIGQVLKIREVEG